MPTYQYSCTECGHFFEIFQSFSEDSLTICPECEGKLRKVYNAVGVVFKGSGFYITDSRSADKGGSGAAESSSASDAGSQAASSDSTGSSSSSSGAGASSGASTASSSSSSS